MDTTHYYIFKKEMPSGKTTFICGGSHDSADICAAHFRAYSYGFMDGASQILGYGNYEMMDGGHRLSFVFSINGQKMVEYFMLLDDEGQDLIALIS